MPEESLLQQVVFWKPLLYTSIGMFVITILFIFISPFVAALMSFAILTLWSRIPAMMTRFTKDLDVGDFFSVMIAITVGGLQGAAFGALSLWFSRIFSPVEPVEATIEDSIAFMLWTPFMPFFYDLWGQNTVFTMYTFTVLRHTTHSILAFVLEPSEVGYEIMSSVIGIPIGFISNTILATLFAEKVTELTTEGLKLSWEILLFIAAVFGLIWLTRFLQKLSQKREKKEEEFGHRIIPFR